MQFIKRAMLAAVLSAAFVGTGAGNAQAAAGCVGFPEYGGLYYHCMTVNTALPKVSTAGTTTTGATVPAFCYFLGCTSQMPVYYSVPVNITTSRPTTDITVFELQYACYESYYYGRSCGKTYTITYDAPGTNCVFTTDDPTLAAYNGTRVRCMV